jgi:hypothetical protein
LWQQRERSALDCSSAKLFRSPLRGSDLRRSSLGCYIANPVSVRWCNHYRQDQHTGIRGWVANIQQGLRSDLQSLRRHEDLWRILRRCGRRVSLRFDTDCQWLRYRGVATQPCRVLQRGGFRPSIGRVPDPKASFAWSTLSTKGCLGRSVADLAFVLSTIAGPDSRATLHRRSCRALRASA